MKEPRETWKDRDERVPLRTSALNQLVVPLPEYKIFFYRGHSFYGADAEEEGLRETRVISPIDAKVVGFWHQNGLQPEAANLLTIRIESRATEMPEAELETSGAPLKLSLVQGDDGRWETEKQLLLVYGSRSDLQGAQFDGVEIVDVSQGTGFKESVKATAGSEQHTLGLIDFLIQDPEGTWRTARYGIFQTRTPTFKLHCPQVGPNHLEVVLDDGDDETLDTVDITRLVDPTAQVTQKEAFQLAVPNGSRRVEGVWDEAAERSRVYLEPPEEGDLALFLYGENRIRIRDVQTGDLLFVAHFLLFLEDEESIAGTEKEEMAVDVEGQSLIVVRDHIMLDFAEAAADYDVACCLYALRLRPQGFTGEFNIVQAAPHEPHSADALLALIETIRGYDGLPVEDVGLDVVDQIDVDFTLERYPDAFRSTNAPVEFDAAHGTFGNAADGYFHHFYIHTFPAHRLIDKIVFPDVDPPSLSLAGAHFETNKTFILPSGRDELRRIYQMRQDHASRKMAVFGHTDRVGTDEHNNQLSLRRGQSAHTLFIKDTTWWGRRLDGRPLQHETPWGMREIQYMLQALGYYHRSIDGIFGSGTRQAVRDLRSAQGQPPDWPIPAHRPPGWTTTSWPLDDDTRGLLIRAYMDHLIDGHLTNADFFQSGAGAPAVFGCGEAYPLVDTQQANQQNRRVVFVLRRTEGAPVDVSQLGSAVPLDDWLSQEREQDDGEPPFLVGAYDAGFRLSGAARNFGGDDLDSPNRLLIKGRRLKRPSLINAAAATVVTTYADGDLTQISVPNAATSPHGTGVITSMACDGEGSDVGGTPRDATQVVLGTGKDISLRPILIQGGFMTKLRTYEALTHDTDIKIVTSSTHTKNITNYGNGANWSQARRDAVWLRIRNLADRGALLFAAAANVNTGSFPNERDIARTERGLVAPDRTRRRADYTGDEAFRRNIAIVGATARIQTAGDPEVPTYFTFLGDEMAVAAPGQGIRMFYPRHPMAPPGPDQLPIDNVNGTSFSTPMTAGIAAEMMLVNPDLQDPANVPQVIEMLEATADLIPSLAHTPLRTAVATAAGSNADPNRGRYLTATFTPGDTDPGLADSDVAGVRRVHFWKAILAAVNGGIPVEAQIQASVPAAAGPPAGRATDHFSLLRGIDYTTTTWYGFEIRVQVPSASVWFQHTDGNWVRLEDTGAAMPGHRRRGTAWRRTQALRVPGTHGTAGYRGFVLPAFPFPGAPWWMCQFSITRSELDNFQRLAVFPEGIYPATDDAPPITELDLGRIVQMRDPGSIARPAVIALERIAEHVEEFSHFVFHVTAQPGAVHSFAVVHAEGANSGEDTEVHVFALDRLGCIKTDFNDGVTLSHTGTHGAAGGHAGVFVNGNPAGASTPLALTNGHAVLQVRNHTQERFRLSVSDGHGRSGQGPEIDVGPPGALAGLQVEVTFWAGGDDPRERNPRVAERLKVTVRALDDQGRVKTDFQGRVELRVVEGEMGWDTPDGNAPFKGGVHVADTVNEAFDAGRFAHTYQPADNGTFDFSVFVYTAGPLVLEAQGGGHAAQSEQLQIQAGPVERFHLDHPDSLTVGNTFNLAVTAQDHYGNTVEEYAEQVELSLQTGTPAAEAAGVRSGVHFESTTGGGTAEHQFAPSDRGVWNFRVTPHTAETLKLRTASASGPAVQADTPDLQVTGAGALDHFGFEVDTAQTQGERFRVRVQALDANGAVITTFSDQVELSLETGTAFILGPPQAGTQIHNSPHAFVAADEGQFAFEATCDSVEQIRFRARSGGVDTLSPFIQVNGPGPLDHFEFSVPGTATAGSPINATVRAIDTNGLVKTDFAGTVTLETCPAPADPADATLGAIGGSPHTYTVTTGAASVGDDGQFTFTVNPAAAGTIYLRARSGGVSTASGPIVVS